MGPAGLTWPKVSSALFPGSGLRSAPRYRALCRALRPDGRLPERDDSGSDGGRNFRGSDCAAVDPSACFTNASTPRPTKQIDKGRSSFSWPQKLLSGAPGNIEVAP